ncbi:MAG: hypothetical protein ACOX4F_00365 [Atopobiaceae bacterium]|jgi:ABC-2 type transport system permease protein
MDFFFTSCLFSEAKYSLAADAGIPILIFVLQMLANSGEDATFLKSLTFFLLFDANNLVLGEGEAVIKALCMGIIALSIFVLAGMIFLLGGS